MTKAEAEEIYIAAIMSGENVIAVKMTEREVKLFRALTGRIQKEMENKNRPLYLQSREYGIEYADPYAIIRKRDADRYEMFAVTKEGFSPLVRKEGCDGESGE